MTAHIYFVSDVITNEGQLLDLTTLQNKFNITINWLDHARVKNSLKYFLKVHIKEYMHFPETICGLYRPYYISVLYQAKSGSQNFYRIFNTEQITNLQISAKQRWERDLNITINQQTWKQIFGLLKNTIQDNYLMWFQYRVLHRILGIKKL